MFFLTNSFCYGLFLAGQRETRIPMYGTIAATVVHLILAPTLAVGFKMNMIGIGISNSVHLFCRYFFTYILTIRSGRFEKSLVPWSGMAFQNLWY